MLHYQIVNSAGISISVFKWKEDAERERERLYLLHSDTFKVYPILMYNDAEEKSICFLKQILNGQLTVSLRNEIRKHVASYDKRRSVIP